MKPLRFRAGLGDLAKQRTLLLVSSSSYCWNRSIASSGSEHLVAAESSSSRVVISAGWAPSRYFRPPRLQHDPDQFQFLARVVPLVRRSAVTQRGQQLLTIIRVQPSDESLDVGHRAEHQAIDKT